MTHLTISHSIYRLMTSVSLSFVLKETESLEKFSYKQNGKEVKL